MPRNPARTLLFCLSATTLFGCAPAPTPQGILLISLDTFRADRLGRLDAAGRSLTPNLDALAARGRTFTAAYSQANETLFSHGSLFTGALASARGPLDYRTWRLPLDADTLAAQFSRAGWHTEAVVAGGHLSPIFGIDAGFQEYTTMSDFSTFQETAPVAIERLRTLAPELREDDRPWLFLVHGYDTHSPYFKQGPLHRMMSPDYAGPMLDHIDDPLFYERVYQGAYYPDFEPPQLVSSDGAHFLDVAMFASLEAHAAEPTSRREALTPADLAFLAGTYDTAVVHADYQVGVLLEELALMGMDQRTHIVVFSDHGEDLQEHGYYNHRHALIDVNLHVPLILAGPNITPARIDTPVAIGDIHPTVLQIGGLAPKPDPAGRPTPDLRAAPDPHRVVYAESLLGEISARDARGRLTMARDALQPTEVPAEAPAGASWTTSEGSAWPPPADLYLALRATAESR